MTSLGQDCKQARSDLIAVREAGTGGTMSGNCALQYCISPSDPSYYLYTNEIMSQIRQATFDECWMDQFGQITSTSQARSFIDVQILFNRPTARSQFVFFGASELISLIRSELSLTVSEIADVMHVRRPTIYSWLRGGELRSRRYARLDLLSRIARYWRSLSNLPLGRFVRESANGEPIIELLKRKQIDVEYVEALLYSISEKVRSAEILPHVEGNHLSARQMRAKHKLGQPARPSEEEVGLLSHPVAAWTKRNE